MTKKAIRLNLLKGIKRIFIFDLLFLTSFVVLDYAFLACLFYGREATIFGSKACFVSSVSLGFLVLPVWIWFHAGRLIYSPEMFIIVVFAFIVLALTLLYIYLQIRLKRTSLLTILGILVLATGFIYWYSHIRIPAPPGWKAYTNTIGFKYSFSYPADWFLTNCGNGEITLTKKPMERCEYPLEASSDYLDNLYFQIFQPTNYYLVTYNWKKYYPGKLDNWQSVYWDNSDGDPWKMSVRKDDLLVAVSTAFRQKTANLRFEKGVYRSIEIGMDKDTVTDNKVQWTLNSFRFP